jgi:hypothetical protein
MLGMSSNEFIELSQSATGREQLRCALKDAMLSEESANSLFHGWLSQDFWPAALWGSGHHLLVCAVLAGGLKTSIQAQEDLWLGAERAIWQFTGFGDRWVEALRESCGWPLLPFGLRRLYDWLRSTPREINRALDWLSGLRWHVAAPRVADTVGQHRLAGWRDPSDKCRKLLETWASEVMSQVPDRNQPPRLINHYIRSMLTGWPYKIPPDSLLAQRQNDPRFVAAARRTMLKMPQKNSAISALVLMDMAVVVPDVAEVLKKAVRGGYSQFSCHAGLVLFLLRRSPAMMLSILDEKPWMIAWLTERWYAARPVLQAVPDEFQLHLRRLLKTHGYLKPLAELGDRSVVPELKAMEKSARLKSSFHFECLGSLVYLCEQHDPEVREALLWRLETGPGLIAAEACRLLALLGEPEALCYRIQKQHYSGDPDLEYRDLLALALGGKSAPHLFAKVSDYLGSVALGDPLAFLQSHRKLHCQCMALIGLFMMAPPDLEDRLRVILEQAAPPYVRLLAAEALEKLDALAPETAVLPIFRTLPRTSWHHFQDVLELYDEDTLRKIVCSLKPIVLPDSEPYGYLVRELERAGFGELLKHENRRTFEQPYFLTKILKLPSTNPDYDQRVLELMEANPSFSAYSIRSDWKGYPHAPIEMIELMAYLIASGLYGWCTCDFIGFAHEHRVCDPRFIALAKRRLDSADQRTYDTCVNYLKWCSDQEG